MRPDRTHNLLSLSDLHLGCDLKTSAPFGDARRAGLDAALAGFLDHHASFREQGKPWRLLLVGDVFDFVAVTAMPAPHLTAPFSICDEERELGLKSEEEKSVWKLRRIAARHEEVFHALARFLIAGHEVHFIRGNHDAELQFPAVQRELVRLLVRRAGVEGAALQKLEQRIQFHAWFYLEPDFLYAEHGNAHDRYCLQSEFFEETPHTSEIELPLSSKVLRNFAARWAKDQEDVDGADKMNALQYIAWIFRMGRPLQIAVDFFALIIRVLLPIASARRLRSQSSRSAESARRLRVRQWLARFSPVEGDSAAIDRKADRLFAIASRPAEQSLFAAAQLFYVDRMLLFFLTALATTGCMSFNNGLMKIPGCALAIGFFFAANRFLARLRRCDAHLLLQDAAAKVAQIFPVRFVVMGHSHHQVDERVADGTRYLNLGSWHPGASGLPYLISVGEEAQVKSFVCKPISLRGRDAFLPGERLTALPA